MERWFRFKSYILTSRSLPRLFWSCGRRRRRKRFCSHENGLTFYSWCLSKWDVKAKLNIYLRLFDCFVEQIENKIEWWLRRLMVVTLSVSFTDWFGMDFRSHCLWPRIVNVLINVNPIWWSSKMLKFILFSILWWHYGKHLQAHSLNNRYATHIHTLTAQIEFTTYFFQFLCLSSCQCVFGSLCSFFYIFRFGCAIIIIIAIIFFFVVVVVDNVGKFLKHMFICHEHDFVLCLW